jgi:hypothetical protein
VKADVCKRSDDDPLIRTLTDRYRLNILRLPRRGVDVGEVLIREGTDLRCAGQISRLFNPPLDVPPTETVTLPDVDGMASARRSASTSAAPLTGLLTALGLGTSSASASLRAARDVTVAYRLTGARYRSTDLLALADELAARVPLLDHPLLRRGQEFYVAHAIAEATGITATFASSTDRAAKLAMELATTIKTDGSIEVTGDHHGRLVVAGSEPVTFGLAVVRLRADADDLRIDPAPRPRAVRGITRVAEDSPSVLLGGPDADALIEVSP